MKMPEEYLRRHARHRDESGAAILIMTVVILVVFVITSTAVYRDATVNQGAARLAALRNDAIARESDMSVRVLMDIPGGIFTAMSAGNGALALNRGNIDIAAIAQTAAAQYQDTSGRITLAGVSTTGKVQSDWITGANITATGTTVSGPFDFLQTSLTAWGSGPVGDAGSADQWIYPRSLFGLRAPGDNFIARRYQWTTTITVTDTRDAIVTAAGRTVSRTATQTRRYTLFEVPFQVSLLADKILNLGQESGGNATGNKLSVQGSVYGRQVNLLGNVAVGGGAASADGVNATAGSVRGQTVTIPSPWGTEIYAPGGILANRQISSANQSRNTAFVTIAPGQRYYSAASGTPTNWDLYTLPFYRCSVRIEITSASLSTPSVTITAFNPTTIAGMTTSTNSWTFNSANWSSQAFVTVASTTNGTDDRICFTIDPKVLATWLAGQTGRAASSFNTIYVGQSPTSLPTPNTAGDVAVSLANTRRLSDVFTQGFALVTKQRFYYSTSFNIDTPSAGCTVIAPDIRYGTTGNANQRVDFTGQIGVVSGAASTATSNPTDFRLGAGQSVALSQKQVTLSQINSPGALPPITLRNWLLISEAL